MSDLIIPSVVGSWNEIWLAGMRRWFVYRGTEWISWISSRDALWSNSRSIHIDDQRNGCYGGIPAIISRFCFWSFMLRLDVLSPLVKFLTAREVQKCRVWAMPESLLLWATLPSCWSIRRSSAKYHKNLLSQVWGYLQSPIQVPKQYPLYKLCTGCQGTADTRELFEMCRLLIFSWALVLFYCVRFAILFSFKWDKHFNVLKFKLEGIYF